MPTLPTGNLTTPAHPSLGEIERLILPWIS